MISAMFKEEPALLETLGPVEGMRVLDLGCGDAAFGRQLLLAGSPKLAEDGWV